MGYLKGGTVVDGNLYIEGGLVVRNISTSAGGQLPTLDDESALSDRLVKFINNNGGLKYSSFGETVSGDEKKVKLYVGRNKEEFNNLELYFGNTNTGNSTRVCTITNGPLANGDPIGISINTSASSILVEDRIIKGIMDDSSLPTIDDAFINNINENTEITAIPESFSYSEN